MPIDVVLRQLNRLPEDLRSLGQTHAFLLLIDMSQEAGRLELDIIKGRNVLAQLPLDRERERKRGL